MQRPNTVTIIIRAKGANRGFVRTIAEIDLYRDEIEEIAEEGARLPDLISSHIKQAVRDAETADVQ